MAAPANPIEALEPFATAIRHIGPEDPDNTVIELRIGGSHTFYHIALGSFRLAREVYDRAWGANEFRAAADLIADERDAWRARAEREIACAERAKCERDEFAQTVESLAWLGEKVSACVDPSGVFHVSGLKEDLLKERAAKQDVLAALKALLEDSYPIGDAEDPSAREAALVAIAAVEAAA